MEALSLRGLARDLGVSHAAPSRHFADRASLISEIAKAGFARSVEAMHAGAEAAGPDPVARYRALGRSYVRFACEEPALFRAINHPEVRDIMDQELHAAQKAWFTTLREGAEAARRAGWHPEVSAEALVAFSVAGALGAATLFGDEKWCESLGVGDADVDSLADDVLDLVVHRSRTTAVSSQVSAGGDPQSAPDEPDSQTRTDSHTRRAS